MNVRFHNEVRWSDGTKCTAKIFWDTKHPINWGRFPSEHPVKKDSLQKFRELGYWASCFPEGDGITFCSLGEVLPDEKIIQDIEECFGFTVSNTS